MPDWKIVYDKDDIKLVRGDCREVLRTLEASSATLILSDPPY